MGKGSTRRPEDKDKFSEGWDRIFNMNELYYIAGLMDGEGSVMLLRTRSSDVYRCPQISMTSTTYDLVELMKDRFGGSISKQKTYQDHHKQSWSWSVRHDGAIRFCAEVGPLLREPKKRARAKLIASDYKSVTPRNGKYTDRMAEKKVRFQEDFLNI